MNKPRYELREQTKSNLLRNLIIIYFIILLLYLSFNPIPIFNIGKITTDFEVIILYFWSLYFPHIFNHRYSFLTGIISDLFSNNILGVTSLTNIIFREIVASQANLLLNKPFILVWAGFATFSFAVVSTKWLFLMILSKKLFYSNLILTSWISGILFYPLIHNIFLKLTINMNSWHNA